MNAPAIDVRPARPSDAADCAAVYASALAAIFPDEPDASRDMAAYQRACAGEEQWVCTQNGKINGFISIYWEENFIHSLYILPAQQRRGAGRALLAAIQSLNRGPLELKVDEVNLSARDFYAHLGWREVGEGIGDRGRWLRLRWEASPAALRGG